MKLKVIALTASIMFVLSFFTIYILASSCDAVGTSIKSVVIRLVIAVVILAVNMAVVNHFYVDGKWRI